MLNVLKQENINSLPLREGDISIRLNSIEEILDGIIINQAKIIKSH